LIDEIEFLTIKMNFDLSQPDVENLLAGFLVDTLGVVLTGRFTNLNILPSAYRSRLQNAEISGNEWIAWSTASGPIAAWAKYDIQASRRINAYVLRVGWCDTLSGHHSLWCYCDPKRPTEWTIGRGRYNEPC
jgi:hypothetical protein